MKNVINWFDIPTIDFQRGVKFYSTILGEEIKVMDFMGEKLGFFPMDGMEGVGGDLVPPSTKLKPSHDGTRVYLNSDGKLDDVLSRMEKAGGKIIQPKLQISDYGWVAMIQDTEGNIVGLHSFK